jgi:hemerythrin
MKNAVIYLKDWLINHINGTDKAYSSFLIGKGVK